MKIFLDQAMQLAMENQSEVNKLHSDLQISHKITNDERQKKLDRNFTESEEAKFERLTNEYDIIRDDQHSEWYMLYLNKVKEIDSLFD